MTRTTDTDAVSLADLIARHRDATGDSYMTLARKTGLSKPKIGQLAQPGQRHMPRAETIEKLAVGLALPLHVVQEAAMVSAGIAPERKGTKSRQRIDLVAASLAELSDDDLGTVEAFVAALVARRKAGR